MNWWQALILGIVEGLTEYLPVSSTGHLILVRAAMGLDRTPASKESLDAFIITIQVGAIAAVLALYWARIKQMVRGLFGGDPQGRRLAYNLLIAFFPAAVLGLLLEHPIEEHLNNPVSVAVALFMGAWLMLLVARNRRVHHLTHDRGKDLDSIDARMALLIGFGQCVAMWPGTSRSMTTILAALLLGLRARDAAEFSFLLGFITLSAATSWKLVNHGGEMFAVVGVGPVVIGIVAAAVSAGVAVKWFVAALTRYGLGPFGWYRLALAVVVAIACVS